MVHDKYGKLKEIVKEMGSVLVAFSGGVDSTFLLKVASDLLGPKVVAATATSPTYPVYELEAAKEIAKTLGVKHYLFSSNELAIPGFSQNPPERCYYCKKELFEILAEKAGQWGLAWVLDGSNADDAYDFRPGRRAAAELKVRSPLAEAGLTKADIRQLSQALGLPTWNKPSFACLSSRFPYGTEITMERLKQVDSCEQLLKELGFTQVRVRYHQEIARIEVDQEEICRFFDQELRAKVVAAFEKLGFDFVALDLKGYRSGSMNVTVMG